MLFFIFKFIHDTIFGWDLVGELPKVDKAVVFSYPHTSYWDGFFILLYSFVCNGYLILKDEGFIGFIAKLFNHITVNRFKSVSQTDQIAKFIKKKDKIWVFMSPEGTTHYKDYIKTGFYYIALKSRVPIVCANYNYRNNTYQYSKSIYVIDKYENKIVPIEEVLELIKEFYHINQLKETGKLIENEAPILINLFNKLN